MNIMKEFRLLISEQLLYWSLRIAPKSEFKFRLALFLSKELLMEEAEKLND